MIFATYVGKTNLWLQSILSSIFFSNLAVSLDPFVEIMSNFYFIHSIETPKQNNSLVSFYYAHSKKVANVV